MRTIEAARRVKDSLYPLTPFTRALEWLVELLPRQVLHLNLIPERDVVLLALNEYRSLGTLPSFEIERDGPLEKGGWFYLEAALTRHTGEREACIFGRDPLKPDSLAFTIPIPSNLRGTIREVIYLPAGQYKLFWCPMRAIGYFSHSALQIHRVTSLEAWLRRAHRVLVTLWEYRRSNNIDLSVRDALDDLQFAYLSTARIQIAKYRAQSYESVISRRERLISRASHAYQARLRTITRPPEFTLVIRVTRNTNTTFLLSTIQSIRQQTYTHWELFLIASPACTPALREVVDVYICSDDRIRYTQNDPARSASNWLAEFFPLFKKPYVAFIGAADVLNIHALLCVAHAIISSPNAEIFYTDHDVIDCDGHRHSHHFKPDWNPDLLLSYNYICDLCVYSRSRLQALGGIRASIPSSILAYDLLLRATRGINSSDIVHIPDVLYHRRSSTVGANADIHVEEGRRAIAESLNAPNIVVNFGLRPGLYHVSYLIPKPAPLVSIIVPTRDRLDVLRKCIHSVQQRTAYPSWEVLLVNNRSRDSATLEWLEGIRRDSRIRVLSHDDEFNYSAINNRAVENSRGTVIVLLNNDVEVITPHWLTEMVGHALRPNVGAVGAKLLYPNGTVQHAGVVLRIGGIAGHVHRYLGGDDPGYANRAIVTQNYSAVTGACLAVRKSVYQEVGGLDAEHLRIAFNDVDFCLKLLRAGYLNVFTPHALLFHHESLTRGQNDTVEKRAIYDYECRVMRERWNRFPERFYNIHSTLQYEDFSLRQD